MKKLRRFICCILCVLVLSSAAFGAVPVSAASSKTTSITQLTSKGNAFKINWKTKSGVKGYQIQYSTSSKFSKSKTKTKTVTSAKKAEATIKNLSGCNKKYYVRIRTYNVVKDKKVYSSWSKAKSVTTLKHKYISATCTEAKTCKYCDKTSGEKLGHKWTAATCTKAKTCARCKKTSGEKLGHKWTTDQSKVEKVCTSCGKTVSNTPYPENYHGHVYTGGSSSTKYHYEDKCAGKYSHEITWEEVTRRNLQPCGTCVLK